MQLTQSHAQRPLHTEGNFLFHLPSRQLQTNSFFIYLTISLCVKKYLKKFSARKLMDDIELSLLQNVTLTYREKWKVSKSTLMSGGKKIAKCQTHHRHNIAWKERETFCRYSPFFAMSAFGICAFERYSLVVDSLLQTRKKDRNGINNTHGKNCKCFSAPDHKLFEEFIFKQLKVLRTSLSKTHVDS